MLRPSFVLVSLALLPCAPLRAQACTDADAAGTVGRTRPDPHSLRNTDIDRLRTLAPAIAAKVQRVHAMLQTVYPAPRGADVLTSQSVGARTLAGKSLIRTELSAGLFTYSCVPADVADPAIAGRVSLGDETGHWITVSFNSLGRLVNEWRQVLLVRTVRGDAIYYAPKPSGMLRGVPVVLPELQRQIKEEAIVLTLEDRSPWLPLSRADFLDARIRWQQARLDSLRAMGPLTMSLKSMDSELQSVQRARAALSTADANLQASIKNPYAMPDELFVAAENGGRPLVIVDRTFYKQGQSPNAVHMITVGWRWQPGQPAVEALIGQLRDRLDVEALRALLAP